MTGKIFRGWAQISRGMGSGIIRLKRFNSNNQLSFNFRDKRTKPHLSLKHVDKQITAFTIGKTYFYSDESPKN